MLVDEYQADEGDDVEEHHRGDHGDGGVQRGQSQLCWLHCDILTIRKAHCFEFKKSWQVKEECEKKDQCQ